MNKNWVLGIIAIFLASSCIEPGQSKDGETFSEPNSPHPLALLGELKEMVEFRLEINDSLLKRSLLQDAKNAGVIADVYQSSGRLIALCDSFIDQLTETGVVVNPSLDSLSDSLSIRLNREFWTARHPVEGGPGSQISRATKLRDAILQHTKLVSQALIQRCNQSRVGLNPYYPTDENLHPFIPRKEDRTWEEMHFSSSTILESLVYLEFCKLRTQLLELDFYTQAPCITWQPSR